MSINKRVSLFWGCKGVGYTTVILEILGVFRCTLPVYNI